MTVFTDAERGMADGRSGEGAALAMRLLANAARLLGAPRLIPIASAHIDGALYHGDSGTLFAERLVAGGAKTQVFSTLNVGALDLACKARVRLPPHERDMAARMMRAYEAMGCTSSWTCAPYQAGHRPAQGFDVAWGESNAVAFCNSVLGARTNRYGDFLDIACALTGRAPDYGLHRSENRRPVLAVDCSTLSGDLKASEAFWPVLGSLYGRLVGASVGVILGLEGFATEDRLKAFGAAAASTGQVALFHIAGVTPEAQVLPENMQDLGRIPVTGDMLRQAWLGLSTTEARTINAVAVGSPHCSIVELLALDDLMADRRSRVPFYACTGRHAVAALEAAGRRGALEAKGVILVADTCVVVTPIMAELAEEHGILMTNSGKFAHYAPGNTGYAVQFGTLADCVESAVAGQLIRDEKLWR